MMRAASYLHSPGRSWPREIRPFPIAPMLMRLDGANAPSADDGTIDGKPEITEVAASVLPAVCRKSRSDRDISSSFWLGLKTQPYIHFSTAQHANRSPPPLTANRQPP